MSYSSWKQPTLGVPQGSVLGSLIRRTRLYLLVKLVLTAFGEISKNSVSVEIGSFTITTSVENK